MHGRANRSPGNLEIDMKLMNTAQPGLLLALMIGSAVPVHATSYGTLCNFDTVNDTGEECHGFEIELEDCHSSDITRTYNYNHYGVPNITEDNSDPAHPRCFIRWEASKNPDGSWSAYTAVPSGPIDPTNGHQFTNPNVNFGGEHFGVSYRSVPTVVHYFWLVDRGGSLVRGAEEVQISTPVFTYNPPAGGAAANVVARVEPPEPAEVHLDEFGPAVWVKSIKTTSHNDHRVELRDLRSDDPDDPDDVNWQNGEPDEVEIEWELMQEEFNGDGEGQGDPLDGGPEDLPDGDEIVTRKWEFYAYTGPVNPESKEAIADAVAEDGVHGVGTKTDSGIFYDLENTEVVGEYLGAQMAAFDVDPEVSLCDHLQDAEEGEAYPDRLVVVGGNVPFTAIESGDLPVGMSFDEITGILSGTPTETGEFEFTVEASDANTPAVSRTYNLRVAPAGVKLPRKWTVDAGPTPGYAGGTVEGGGDFDDGQEVTLSASPAEGYRFGAWTELGSVVSTSQHYAFPAGVNRQVRALFHPVMDVHEDGAGDYDIEWPGDADGWVLEENDSLDPAGWTDSGAVVSVVNGKRVVTVPPSAGGAKFYRLRQQ